EVKARLDRWLSAIEDQDPYRVLGLSPLATVAEVKERYRELAFRTHPDRGGNAERMRELNLAYERILDHQTRRRSAALPSVVRATSGDLPA
ncbi:MAG TPA: J domain-containing protein, partial [Myxococcaceae bacterium]|nr:J domain-containing protein [Myxococcaceae bacterium]